MSEHTQTLARTALSDDKRMEAWHTVYTELARPPPLFVCFDSFGMFLKLENRVLSLHSSEEDVGSCGILVPWGLEHEPCWTTVWLGPWRRKEPLRLHLSHPSKAFNTGTTSQAPPWRFGSEVGWESWQSEFSRCLGVRGKVLEPGRDLSSFVCWSVCLF